MQARALAAALLVSLLAVPGPRTASGQAPKPIAPELAALYTLVDNGGFENGDARPSFWRPYPRKDEGGNRLLRDTTVAHSGKASGLIWSVTPHVPGKPGMQWNHYHVDVEGGSDIIFSAYVKTEGCQPCRVGCHFYQKDKAHLGFVGKPFRGKPGEWVYLRERIQVPERASLMGVALYANQLGKTWFDDVAILGTPTTTATRGKPKLDGKLDDACWAEGKAITQFVVHTGAGLAREKTRAWIAYDNDALYVAFRCPHPPGAALKTEAAQHDGNVWLDDSIEVFLDPDHDHKDYFQWSVNSAGRIRDSRGTDAAWQSGASAAVARGGGEWLVEMAIPYDRLGLTMDVADTWGINLVRNDRVNRETVTWSLGGFHSAGRFGNVKMTPEIWRFCRTSFLAQLDQQQQDAALLQGEMRAAQLGAHTTVKPLELLASAKSQRTMLRGMAQGRISRSSWATAKGQLSTAAKLIVDARSAAIEALFVTQGAEQQGFRVAIGHSLQKVRRSGPVTEGVIAREVKLAAARDETESFQLVVIPTGRALAGVTVTASPLRGAQGAVPVSWHRVGYVETAPPGYPTEYVGWWPDPLLPPEPFDVRAGQRQPIWLDAAVPPDARPGRYSGEVVVWHRGQSVRVPVALTVRAFRLPRPGTLATAFGLYAQLLSNGYYRGPYREKMKLADFAKWCELLGKYRLTPKNIAREYITVEREGDEWRVDLSQLESTVGDLAPKYYAPYSFCLHRVPTGPTVLKGIQAGRPADVQAWANIVRGIDKQWRAMGLPRQVYIYGADEPRREIYPFLQKAYAKLKEVAPDYPIMQTIGDPAPHDLVGYVDIWCPLTSRLDSDFYAQRVAAGDTLWTYVCCSPKHPYANFFIDRPATEHRVLFWQTWSKKATGFLYWFVAYWRGAATPSATDKPWPQTPFRLKDLGTYKSYKDNGDGLLLYPGPNMTPYPSLRLAVVRDGIEDYEYLALLSRLVAKAKALPPARRPAAGVVEQAEALCQVPAYISRSMASYTDRPEHILGRRGEVADMIERLMAATEVE